MERFERELYQIAREHGMSDPDTSDLDLGTFLLRMDTDLLREWCDVRDQALSQENLSASAMARGAERREYHAMMIIEGVLDAIAHYDPNVEGDEEE